MPVLSLDGVNFNYGSDFALLDINLLIPEKGFLALIGPNGSGKTTLLQIMSGRITPKSGTVRLGHDRVGQLGARELAKRVAVISSEQYFEFPFSAEEVVSMGRFPHLGRLQRFASHDWEMIERALQMTRTTHLRNRPISQLSSGERQRVLIARTIAQETPFLMLDEPNAHLDINHQIAVFRLLQELNRDHDMSIIVVLHDLTAAAAFSQTVALLDRGKLVTVGPPREVITTENVRAVYGADVVVHPSPEGGFPQVTYSGATTDS